MDCLSDKRGLRRHFSWIGLILTTFLKVRIIIIVVNA